MTYSELEPAAVWEHFAALNKIPRVSKNETAAIGYVIEQAESVGAVWKRDAYGNVVVQVQASASIPSAATVMIQAHVDMVPAVASGTSHDWATEPIIPRRVGYWIYGTGTTLGADNGIGAAMALALLTTDSVTHGPLELLFTVEEEIGLRGASHLDASMLSAKYMINLDSEEIEKLTIGCTGGATLEIAIPASRTAPTGSHFQIVVTGALGGHSGLEIDKPRANPMKILASLLKRLTDAEIGVSLSDIWAGSAANAIPTKATALIDAPGRSSGEILRIVSEFQDETLAAWKEHEPHLEIQAGVVFGHGPIFSRQASDAILDLIKDLPHAVQRWSDVYPGKVETSANVAQISVDRTGVKLIVSVRSFIAASLDAVQQQIRELAARAGGTVQLVSAYPGWEPNDGSHLLKLTEQAYVETYGHTPEIEVVHAGLECGAIISKLPGLEAVSFGPDIRGAHTSDECVSIPTVASTWEMLKRLLSALAVG